MLFAYPFFQYENESVINCLSYNTRQPATFLMRSVIFYTLRSRFPNESLFHGVLSFLRPPVRVHIKNIFKNIYVSMQSYTLQTYNLRIKLKRLRSWIVLHVNFNCCPSLWYIPSPKSSGKIEKFQKRCLIKNLNQKYIWIIFVTYNKS